MEKFLVDKIDMVCGAVIAFLSALLGQYWYMFAAEMGFQVIDYFTGTNAAKKTGHENSDVGRKGILKKVYNWCIIAIAFMIPNVFIHLGNDLLNVDLSFLNLLGWFTLASLMINELRSIIENLVILGVYVPDCLVKGLDITSKLLRSEKEQQEKEAREAQLKEIQEAKERHA